MFNKILSCLISKSLFIENKITNEVMTLLIEKKEAELVLIYLSELPHSDMIEFIGKDTLKMVSNIERKISKWDKTMAHSSYYRVTIDEYNKLLG